MAGYTEGLKKLLGAVCTVGSGAVVLGKKVGKKGEELLYYFCSAGFLGLALLTRRQGNPPPAQVAPPPPPGQEAPRPKPRRTKNVRPQRPGDRHMRRPGANRGVRLGQQPPPGFICFVNSRGREIDKTNCIAWG